jgi:zinc resistance-associated protein
MWKKVLIASAVVAMAGSTLVYAQRPGDSGGPDGTGQTRGSFGRFRPSADDLSAFTDARIAAMKAGLRLTPDQDKNWPAFEQAYRNLAKLRTDRIVARREGTQQPPADMLDGLQQRADSMIRGAVAFKQLSDSAAPLYRSLDEAQKQRFAILARMLRPMPMRGGHGRPGQDGGGNMQRGHLGSGQFQSGGFAPPRIAPGAERSGPMEHIRFEVRPLDGIGSDFGNDSRNSDVR